MDLRSERMLSTVRTTQRSIADLLNENRAKTEALSIALASINPNSGRATVVATDKNHTLVDAESIVFPSHVLLMLPLTPLSAPIPASEFVLPQSFTQFADNHIVVAMIRDMQNEVMGVVLIFVSNSVLTAQQHDYIDIMRQKSALFLK